MLATNPQHIVLSTIEDTAGLQYYAPCKTGDFKCANRKCVKSFRVCNGIDDCGDKSDERVCQYAHCRSEYYMCLSGSASGYCIHDGKKCDKVKDCYEGEDEDSCEAKDINCDNDEFKCKTGVSDEYITEFDEKYGTMYCIGDEYKCDGIEHCANKADEANCPDVNCDNGTLSCGSDGFCLSKIWVCDAVCDCTDCRDESDDKCTFTCKNGIKIPASQKCDHYNQCGDKSDEVEEECKDEFPVCNEKSYFQCDNKQCIDERQRCDYVYDCYDKSDERNCNCSSIDYICENGECVHEYAECNTVIDCSDQSDEKGCNETEKTYPDYSPSNWDDDWYIRYLDLLQGSEDQSWLIENFKNDYTNWGFERIEGEFPPDWIRFLAYSSTPDFSDLQDILKLTKAEISHLGHQVQQMIIQCTYGGRKCYAELDFHQFQHDKYGNCYTFNSNKNNVSHPLGASQPGAENGLKLTLYTEQHEYISIFGQESGIKVSVHNQFETPFPEESAITVSPGRATSIGVKKQELIRKGSPYGSCSAKSAAERNLIYDGDSVYTTTACRKSCYQKKLIDVCNCVDTVVVNGTQRCQLLDFEQERCRQLVKYLHSQQLIQCDCPFPCSEIVYHKTVSQSLWPSDSYVKTLLDSLYVIDSSSSEHVYDLTTAQRNLVRLEVYFEDLSYVSISESPAYTWENLFGDVGGTLGLYIGLSLLTLVEFFEYFLDLILFGLKKVFKRNQVHSVT